MDHCMKAETIVFHKCLPPKQARVILVLPTLVNRPVVVGVTAIAVTNNSAKEENEKCRT